MNVTVDPLCGLKLWPEGIYNCESYGQYWLKHRNIQASTVPVCLSGSPKEKGKEHLYKFSWTKWRWQIPDFYLMLT